MRDFAARTSVSKDVCCQDLADCTHLRTPHRLTDGTIVFFDIQMLDKDFLTKELHDLHYHFVHIRT